MEQFCKQDECPASEELVAMIDHSARMFMAELEEHLAGCDFCSAEIDLYRHHPPIDENVRAGKIPQPLFELAQALLQRNTDLTPLNRLIGPTD